MTKAVSGWGPWEWSIAGAVAVGALAVAWILWWWLPKYQVSRYRFADAKTRADVEDTFRKTSGQLIGGAALLIGAGFAYLQFTQQQRSAHDQLISNQVSKGFELLGNKDREFGKRLGGIYTLEEVMNDPAAPHYYQPVLEALCAFVRDETKAKTDDEPPGTDIQAALTVIGRRDAGKRGPDLRDAHLPKAEFLLHANLVGGSLQRIDLRQARLPAANLADASLGEANLTEAFLTGTNLSRAQLQGAKLMNATLIGADFSGANLAPGINATSPALVKMSDLDKLSGADLSGALLMNANLSNAVLLKTNLTGAHLYGANLTNTYLHDVIGLTQEQLDKACGTGAKVDPPLTFHDKPCLKASQWSRRAQ